MNDLAIDNVNIENWLAPVLIAALDILWEHEVWFSIDRGKSKTSGVCKREVELVSI